MKRGESDVAFWCEQVRIGAIERFHEWVRHAAHDEPVDARPGTVRTIYLEARVVVNRGMIVFEDELTRRWTTHGEVKLAAQEQECIMERLGIEPLAVHTPQESIICIDLGCRGRRRKKALTLLV